MNSLGEGYTETDIRDVLSGKRQHTPKKKRNLLAPQKDSLLIDIQRKMDEGKGAGYVNWAKRFNIKQMAQTVNLSCILAMASAWILQPLLPKPMIPSLMGCIKYFL